MFALELYNGPQWREVKSSACLLTSDVAAVTLASPSRSNSYIVTSPFPEWCLYVDLV